MKKETQLTLNMFNSFQSYISCESSLIVGVDFIKLSDFVKRTRDEKGFSLKDVARQSGETITDGYVSQIENEKTKVEGISIEKLKALAKGLKVSEEEIFTIARGVVGKNARLETKILFHGSENWSEKKRKAIWAAVEAQIAALDAAMPDETKD